MAGRLTSLITWLFLFLAQGQSAVTKLSWNIDPRLLFFLPCCHSSWCAGRGSGFWMVLWTQLCIRRLRLWGTRRPCQVQMSKEECVDFLTTRAAGHPDSGGGGSHQVPRTPHDAMSPSTRRGTWSWPCPVDCSMPDFPVLYHLQEFAQTHVHWVDDAIQPSHPLLSLSPPPLNLSQHQDLFQWVSSSFQWIFSVDYCLVWSPCSQSYSQEPSPTLQFESIISLTLSLLYGPTLTSIHDYWKNQSFGYMDLCQQSDVSAF